MPEQNPYLPSSWDRLATMLSSLGAGISQAGAQGRPFWAGIGPGAMLFAQAQARAQQQAMQQQQVDASNQFRERQLTLQEQEAAGRAAERQQQIDARNAYQPPGGGVPTQTGVMPTPTAGSISPADIVQDRIRRGDNPIVAAGWAANVEHESSFRPGAVNPRDPNGGSFGLIQWNGPRRQALNDFAAARGANPADPKVQLDFLQSEIDADPAFKARLDQAKSPAEAASIISQRFIRPAGGQDEATSRGQSAGKYVPSAMSPELTQSGYGAPQPSPVVPVGAPQGGIPQGGGMAPPSLPMVPRPALPPADAARIQHMVQSGQITPAQGDSMANGIVDQLWQVQRERARAGYQVSAEQYRHDRDLAEQRAQAEAAGQAATVERQDKRAQQMADREDSLRDDFDKSQTVQNYRVVVPILRSAQEAAERPTRASDVNLVYAIGKIMDPGSVVREGEMIMIQNAGSLSDTVLGAIGKLNGGQMLQPETRRALIAELNSRAEKLRDSYQSMVDHYTGIAKRRGLEIGNIIAPLPPLNTGPMQQPPVPGMGIVQPGSPVDQATPGAGEPVYDLNGKRVQ